ncbi:hypothetical protein AB1Y20_003888 [Prymnesium parvum]|uniref:Rab GDP dissociation inhibitor n=1 Tax=Prymnesium parvum TaxID=97485 RepID=A0AB34J913_PRYPA
MASWRVPTLAALLCAPAVVGGSTIPSAPSWQAAAESRYDVVVLGTGLKESLLSGLLASHGKRVLQLERSAQRGGDAASVDLQRLAERTSGPEEQLSPARLGKLSAYSIDAAPKAFVASGTQLQLFVQGGAWSHMDMKRVQRSLLYRKKPDGTADVHRVLANAEDVLKTRFLKPMEKAKMLQLFVWVEKYDESNPATFVAGLTQKRTLKLKRMSAAGFLKYWDLSDEAKQMVCRGLALYSGPTAELKKMSALTLVRRIKRYKDAYKTFSHMTSPYVYPVGGFGTALPKAVAEVLEENDGYQLLDRPIDRIVFDDSGAACGVESEGVEVKCGCVVAAPEYVPDRVTESHKVVRLYAVLAHAPNLCKEATSCHLVIPAQECGRSNDIFLFAGGPTLGVAPKGKWLVVASTRLEGECDGEALALAKRELAAVLPLLKPAKKLLAEVVPCYAPKEDEQPPEGLHLCASCDETTHFDSVEEDVLRVYEAITGEPLKEA